MVDIRPFRALRPEPALAEKVASPPYDVLSSAEAAELAKDNPHSFLHVIKPEIDLPAGTNLYADEVYAKGAENLERLQQEGVLFRDDAPHFYVYAQVMGDHRQVGIVAGGSVKEYDEGVIKKHEKTRQKKEDDRTRHVDALDANTGPVFLTYRHQDDIDAFVKAVCESEPTYDFTAPDGIRHTLWVVDEAENEKVRALFASLDVLYIADGHHRSASASRVAQLRRDAHPDAAAAAPWNYFLTVIFPDNQMKILDYNRVVADMNGLSKDEFLSAIAEKFEVEPGTGEKPSAPRTFGMYCGGDWYVLRAKEGTFDAADPVLGLDVSILQDNLLSPILGIGDPRSDERIDFVGGIRGTAELKRRVDEGEAVAFALFPTSMDELMAIADAGEIMPPKSTWFEPKLRSGLIVRPLSD